MTDLTVLSKLQEILEELKKLNSSTGKLVLPDRLRPPEGVDTFEEDLMEAMTAPLGTLAETSMSDLRCGFSIRKTGETALGGVLKVEKIETTSPEDENARRVLLLERRLTELDKTFRHIFGDGEEADAVEELVNQALRR